MNGKYALHGQKQRKPIEWKGKTFSQITTIIKRNEMTSNNDENIFRPMPVKHYRREIASVNSGSCNPRSSQSQFRDFETPGGSIVKANFDANGDAVTHNNVNGLANTMDINYNESKTARPSCKSCSEPFEGEKVNDMRSLSQEDNARRRVRSSGMDRPKYIENTGQKKYYSSTAEYLHSRNKQHSQNQFHNLQGAYDENDPTNNKYRTSTLTHCKNDGSSNYVPVHYKPNNSKFAQQGAVDSSSRLARLKLDTITKSGATYRVAFDKYGAGNATANALAYGVPANGYTIKDKLGYPNKRTPIVKTCSTNAGPRMYCSSTR
jgi:hypothetical protein